MNQKLTLYPASPMTCRTIGTFPLWMLIVFCLSFLPHAIQAGNIYRVSPNGTGDGSSWSNTTNLRNALDLAQEGDEIWVQGFREAETHDKDKHYCVPADMPDGFVVREGIKLYGGFAGTENSIDERLFTEKVFCFTYRTILTGDINDDDVINPLTLIFPSNTTRTDNATHVLVVHSGTGSTATTVNGFTIADGQADGDGEKGGGILVTGSGGNYNIEKCYFVNNYATTGGAVYVEPDAGSSTSSVSLCRVFNNAAGTRSSSNNDGGGLCIAGYGHVDNCVITNNENGGVLLASKAYVINATIARNTSGGIDLMTENIGNNIQVYNTVVWRNTTPLCHLPAGNVALRFSPGTATGRQIRQHLCQHQQQRTDRIRPPVCLSLIQNRLRHRVDKQLRKLPDMGLELPLQLRTDRQRNKQQHHHIAEPAGHHRLAAYKERTD